MTGLVMLLALVQGQNENENSKNSERLRAIYVSEAAKYQFALQDETEKLTLEKKPIMAWTGQESSGTVSGDVFVWSSNGRPEVIGCIGSLPTRNPSIRSMFVEFHTLSDNNKLKPIPLTQTNKVWRPKPRSAPAPIPAAPKPAKKRSIRLAQMRLLARQFKPRMRESDGDRAIDNLRLMPEPLHRLDEQAVKNHPDVIDGAIFCYVWTRGTDPELLILVEAKKTAAGPKWHYTPLRFTNRELWLNHKTKQVWHVPPGDGKATYAEPYITEWKYGSLDLSSPAAASR